MKRPPGLRGWIGCWLLALIGFASIGAGCGARPDVVVYCAQDQAYAEPIFAAFTAVTGIGVRAVFDSEAVKTVGLANRLLTEREHPAADVFWGNEEFQTRRLAALGVFRSTNGWAGFGQRSRRLVVGKQRPELAGIGLAGLTNAALRGRVSLAAPWFGSTATHLTALRAEWGETAWRAWCRALAANQVFLEEGNSHVVRRVARGEAWVGLTDSDDIISAQADGLPVLPGPVLWRLRNTVAILHGAPRASAAEQLFQYLQSAGVQEKLRTAGALEAPTDLAVEPRWDDMLRDFATAGQELRGIFAP